MKEARLPGNERERLEALKSCEILDTLPEQSYDDITFLAAQILDVPMALVSLVDSDRQWFKSRVGLEAAQTDRTVAFCSHAILQPDHLFVVENALEDDRFWDNPLVTNDPSIRFYAGAPLVVNDEFALGTLCVLDSVPRELSDTQAEMLQALSRQVVVQFELRRAIEQLQRTTDRLNSNQRQLEEYHHKLEEANRLLHAETITDNLTGLNNRRAFQQRLSEEADRALRYGTPISLFLIDVDHFKAYNDDFGHPEGDEALKQVGTLLNSSVRSTDFVARYGGEEFAIILPNTDRDGAMILAERCRRIVESGPWSRRPVTVSIGTTSHSSGCTTGATLISEADKALYHSKGAGRNRVSDAVDVTDFPSLTGQFKSLG